MKKVIRLTESDLEQIVKKVLNEQVSTNVNPKNLKFGDRDKPEDVNGPVHILQKKLMDMGFLKTKSMKPTGYFGNLTKNAVITFQKKYGISQTGNVGSITSKKLGIQELTNSKPVLNNPKSKNGVCQVITPTTDIKDLVQIVDLWKRTYPSVEPYGLINRMMNKYATSYVSQGIPQRTACEIALLQIRPGYKDKNAFIVDTLTKLLYVYDTNGKFVAKTDLISGKNEQSLDPSVIAKSLMTWNEQVTKLGFKWVNGKGYIDQTGKNRKYDDEIIYSGIDKSKSRFLPKGIYTTGSLVSNADYAGKTQNLLNLYDSNKKLAQAIHGYYLDQPRTEALRKAAQVLSNPNDKKVGKEFLDLVANKEVNLSQSYGCINVPENFIKYLREYGPNSYVFNMGENKQNYLVNNTENYFDKMQNSESCPSPKSLAAIPVSSINIA
jgi:peptidoglycan hydrolase-like protein with peptidoglycan-binding domain